MDPLDGALAMNGDVLALEQVVTQSRARVGTPAYMAPEVLEGQPAGPRSDQYSLCVSIYESLVGRRPPLAWPVLAEPQGLLSRPVPARTPAASEGLRWAPLPRALRRVLARGLARLPADRFASVQALVDALVPIVERRRQRRLLAGAGLCAAVVAGGLTVRALAPPVPAVVDPCAGVEDELTGVWDEASRVALHERLLATDVPYAAALSEWAQRGVDDLAQQWVEARRDACEAHAVDRTLSDDGLARATVCLDGQRAALGALVHATFTADRLPNVTTALASLEPPAECVRRARLESAIEPPADAQRAAVESLRATLQATYVAAVLEGTKPHREAARAAHTAATALGYDPLRAEAALVLGRMLVAANDPSARAYLDEAANLAEQVGDLATRESALQELVRFAFEVELDEEELARALARDAAALRRLGDPPSRRATLLELDALAAAMTGDFAAAESSLREAIDVRATLGTAHVLGRIAAWHHLGNLLAGRGRHDEAAQAFAAADQAARAAGLPAAAVVHGSLARGRGELLRGIAATNAGRFDEARRWLDQAVAETTRAYGADSVPMSRVHMAHADLAMRQGQLDDVLSHARAADANVRRWLGDDHGLRLAPLSALGTVAFHQGRAAEAVAAFEEALRLAETTLPPQSPTLASLRSNLGEALVLAGDDEHARLQLESALQSLERTLPPLDELLAYPSHGLAEIAWRAGALDEAAEHAQRALRIREHHRNDPPELARVRWLLARIEAARGHVPEARALAQAARTDYESLGPAFAESLEPIDAWLRALR